ncbi:MAG: phosphoribosyl-ATP diphosphatase [Actinobacteria bacterium]|nr:phosphoribosyl-ATP diphosphatase [Actinomycetota bacterium]
MENEIFNQLYQVVLSRREEMPENSYTTKLFKAGLDEILKKVGEESIEIILASKEDNKEHLVYEIADFIYHLIVLMVEKDISFNEIEKELVRRRK